MQIGALLEGQAKFKEAIPFYKEAILISTELNKHEPNSITMRNLSMTKLNLGKALLETDKARDSIKHFKESHEIALSRFKKYPNAAEKRDLAFTYLNLGNSILKIEGKNQAKDYFYKYLKLNQEL